MTEQPSLARGAELTAETWADFVARLHHDIKGEGVREHCTADAVFLVQQAVEQLVPDGYGGTPVIFDGCEHTETVQDFFDGCCEETKAKLNASCDGSFLDADAYDQEQALEEHLPDYSLLYVTTRWETLNQHFTKDAAEAFIKRKKHDYRKGLRVYVDCSCYSWELNAIKEAILAGRIGFIPERATQPAAQGMDAQTLKHISALSELVRMPNAEHFADAHNAAVHHLRALAAKAKQGGAT